MQYKVTFSDLGTITVDAVSSDDAMAQALTWAKGVLKPSVLACVEITVNAVSQCA